MAAGKQPELSEVSGFDAVDEGTPLVLTEDEHWASLGRLAITHRDVANRQICYLNAGAVGTATLAPHEVMVLQYAGAAGVPNVAQRRMIHVGSPYPLTIF